MAAPLRPSTARIPFLLAAWLGVVDAYLYVTLVVQPQWASAKILHSVMAGGTAESPYRYRILVPWVAEAASRVVGLEAAYVVFYFVVFPVALCSLLRLLKVWYATSVAVIGTVLLASVLPLAFRDHYFQPATWLELVLMIWALQLLVRPSVDLRAYAALSMVAAMNRETGVLLGLLLVAVTWPVAPARRCMTAIVAVAPLATYAALRINRGNAPPAEHDLLARNFHDLPTAVLQVALFGAAFVFLAVIGWRAAPLLLRRAAWIVPVYLVLIGLFGVWRQVRLLVPLAPIAVGLALAGITRLDADEGRPPVSLQRGPVGRGSPLGESVDAALDELAEREAVDPSGTAPLREERRVPTDRRAAL